MDDSENGKSKNFFKYVFNFNEESKHEMLNIVQYSLLAIIPIVILNKLMQKFVPEADELKSSLEIVFEILAQIIFIFITLLIVDRFITFFSTYSGTEYPKFSVVYIILPFLMITLSLQTKLGEKVNIIVERINELWEGKGHDNKGGQGGQGGQGGSKNTNIKVIQPISNGMQPPPPPIPTNNYSGTTSINQLPASSMGSGAISQPREQLPDYNSMHQNNPTPLVNAHSPTNPYSEPMAANDALGGGSFGGW
jgi:hypothetical protein